MDLSDQSSCGVRSLLKHGHLHGDHRTRHHGDRHGRILLLRGDRHDRSLLRGVPCILNDKYY